MSGYTPGPWVLSEGDSVVAIKASDGSNIAATTSKFYWQRHDDQDVANARLIAASPESHQGCVDLCDILRRIQDTLSRHVDPSGDLQDPMATVNALLDIADRKDTLGKQRAALAAIAKAEGRTP